MPSSDAPGWAGVATGTLALAASAWTLWKTRGHAEPRWRLEVSWRSFQTPGATDPYGNPTGVASATLRNAGDGDAYDVHLATQGCDWSSWTKSNRRIFWEGDNVEKNTALALEFQFDQPVDGTTVTITWTHPPARRRRRQVTWTLREGQAEPAARPHRFVAAQSET